jgi:protein ImuB
MFATIYLPNFYLQAALRHQPELRDKPTALIQEQDKKPLLIQLNRAAESAGVRKGMTPSQALARCLHVVIKARSRPNESAIGDLLLQHAFSLSPNVEATAPGVATVQFTDTRNVIEKVAEVVQRLTNCEVDAHIGIAWTPDSSFLAAHLAEPVLYVDDVRKFLAPLPIETLAIR